ncbi:conserved hypothetical protein [Leishmania mexicana MHOM/GT/2001/U1103]|uniref:Uncharacterized protein n=1 Tax=Leishmania mexicana (strain MHOM/GT/2001/U1103) TaxID=929439 RepID=E9AYW2_LEIMU|nr:conserved hypothetical protein [Leishmania mexicana MHOM/GT/2001/U1103]CBZ28156.1 conserved hypothetical protein [Leishmania mexicana MHOM/GT/2001/U1103]
MVDYHLPPITSSKGMETKSTLKKNTDDYALCQEYAAHIAQLRGLLEETTGEPPAGVRTADVEHRIALIQSALDEVERLSAEVRWRIELRNNQRFLDTYERRIRMEEEAEQKRQNAEKERIAQVEEMRSMQLAYYKDRNGRTDAKAHQCRAHNEQVQEQTVMKADSNEDRRIRNLANLEAERQRKQKELHYREQAKQEYVHKMRERQARKGAEKLAERARLAAIHQQEMEAKLSAIRESRRSKWVMKKEASRARSVVVWKNGEAILETQRKDHNCLVEELEQRQRQQASRYAEEKAEQAAYIEQRRQLHAARQERQRENLLKLVDKRLARGVEIVKTAEEKKDRAEQAKERQATQYVEAGKLLDEDVHLHRQRARKLQERRANESRAQNYRRWNHRAARIMEELRETIAKVETEAEQRAAAANSQRGSLAYDDRQRYLASVEQANTRRRDCPIVSLPSPTEFAA